MTFGDKDLHVSRSHGSLNTGVTPVKNWLLTVNVLIFMKSGVRVYLCRDPTLDATEVPTGHPDSVSRKLNDVVT